MCPQVTARYHSVTGTAGTAVVLVSLERVFLRWPQDGFARTRRRIRRRSEANDAARKQQQDGTWWRDHALRACVEGAVCQAADTTGLRRARYGGLPKAHLDHTAAALNLIEPHPR